MSDTMRWCSGCEAETGFEVIVLQDCSEQELGCIDCGAAIVLGVQVPGLLSLAEPDRADWSALAAIAA